MQAIKIIAALCLAAITLTGCNSTEQTLQPIPGDGLSADQPQQPGVAPISPEPGLNSAQSPALNAASGQSASATPGSAAPASATPASLPAGQVRGRIRFTPVIGAPVNAVTPLSRQLAVQARNRGLAILSAADTGGDHVLKGYFSAETFDGQTTVFYVWDILDPAGARMHRIQGQESVTARSGDPWAAVPADVMERIATRSIDDYVNWRGL
ncbi:hypothetical protein [uncultured Hoeflea sp.]|uniref:hypothetical protein n=1 Tax=uncultured Hoeflea sp. TaxID=538666 RepID=UPI002634F83B|nr:hypothetical protein [uncultured Hoeflea sp.]